MNCPKCGNPINQNIRFCTNCGTKNENYVETAIQTTTNEKTEDDKQANLLCIVSLILAHGMPVVTALLSMIHEGAEKTVSSISGLSYLAAIVLMIVARVKYPKNKFAKILMWIYIVEISLAIIGVIIFIIACITICKNMPSNCG